MPLTLVLGPANSAKAGVVLGAYADAARRGALLVVPTAVDARQYAREVAGEGRTYTFPRDPEGHVVCCNVEGISWTAPDQFVVVSDKAKGTQHRRCRARDQSIHVFGVPAR